MREAEGSEGVDADKECDESCEVGEKLVRSSVRLGLCARSEPWGACGSGACGGGACEARRVWHDGSEVLLARIACDLEEGGPREEEAPGSACELPVDLRLGWRVAAEVDAPEPESSGEYLGSGPGSGQGQGSG